MNWFRPSPSRFALAYIALAVLALALCAALLWHAWRTELFWYGIVAAVAVVLGLGAALAWLFRRTLARSREELEELVAHRTDALQHSDERYALAMDASQDAHWDWIIGSDEYFFSPNTLELYGLPQGTPRSGSRKDFMALAPFLPEDREAWKRAVEAHFAGKAARLSMELRIERGGEIRWLQLNGLCVRDTSGAPVRWTGTTRDVTEHKQMLLALRESDERYALAMEAAGEGHWDWKIDTEELYVSPRFLEMGGFAPDVKYSSRNDLADRYPFHPEDRPKYDAAMAAHFAGETPRVDIVIRTLPNGQLRWLHVIGMCLRDGNGKPVRWAGSANDVTERMRAEQALRVSEERYALAMQASGEGHWDWKIETDEFYVSPRYLEIGGFAPDFRYSSRTDLADRYPFHPEDRPKHDAARAAHFAGETPRMDIVIRTLPNGQLRWLHVIGMCLRDANGKPVRWAGSVNDVTERMRAGQALCISEERYARAMEGSDAGHWDWNVVSDEMYVSPSAKAMLRLPETVPATRNEIMGLVPIHPDDRHGMAAAVRASFASGSYEREYRIMLPGGGVRWVHSRAKVFRDASGAAVRMTGSLIEITERKLAADALRESEARFRALTELSSDWYWKQDEQLRFTYFSDEVRELAGYPEESSIGRTRWELEDVTPLSCSWAEHQAVLAARLPFRDFEYCRPDPDGRARYIYTSSSGAPIFDEKGVFKGYQGAGRNITERKRIEEELRSRQEMLELAQKAARAIAFEWRMGDGKAEQHWSPDLEAMYGLAPGSYDGTYESWKKLVHPDDWPGVKEAIKHARRSGDVASEYRVVHPDGTVHWLQAKGRMFFHAAGNPSRMVGFMQDVTQRRHAEDELRKMEDALRQAQKLEAMGTLAGGIAHDFNNILGAILGYGEMALRNTRKDTRLRRDLDSIMTAGERGRALVDRVLAFSRSGVGERVAVHVEAVVREALDLLAGDLPVGARIRADLRAGRAAMLGDPTQVHQVVMNLVTNGVQAMPKGGLLRVSLERVRIELPRAASVGALSTGAYVVLKVADVGTGIRPEVLERMFDPFFTTKEVGVGSGLGLSLVHGIVTNLGGAIDVATELGKGSTFIVYFPRSGGAVERRKGVKRSLPRGDGQRVLVVDDEAPLVRLATETLEDLGYAPVGFTSSASALREFGANPSGFDAILTDERMPGVTGSTIIREVRRINPSIPILLMSGYLGAAAALHARELGANDVLKKPLLARELASSLARVFNH